VARRACGVHQPQARPRLFFSRPCLTARQHTARLPAAEHSIDHLHGAAENPDPRRTIMTLTGHGMQERFEHVYLAAAAALAGITTFFRPLHIHWQLYHPPQPRGPAHLEVSSVAAQGWWVRVASKWICSSRSPVEGVTRVRASGMLIPTAGLLLLRQASMDVAVSPSRAHTATAAARRARAGRVHAVC
jgi:hypothetical protein